MPDIFSEDEIRVIRECALDLKGAREKAVEIFRRKLHSNVIGRGNPYFDFMSEVDSPCPDLHLRGRLRRQILGPGSY